MKVDYEDAKLPFLPGEYRIVEEGQVADLSKQGWFLVQILEETGQRPYERLSSWECKNGHSNCGVEPRCHYYDPRGQPCPSGRPPSPVVTLHRYVMRHGVNEVILAANAEVEAAKKQAYVLAGERKTLEMELQTLKKEATEANQSLAEWRSHYGRVEQQRDALGQRLRDLERDLAKVRNAIGETKWKEMTG